MSRKKPERPNSLGEENTDQNWPSHEQESNEEEEESEKEKINYPDPTNKEQAESNDILDGYKDKVSIEYALATRKSNREKPNQDGVSVIETENSTFFTVIDGVGSSDGFNSTKEILKILNEEVDNDKDLEEIINNVNQELYKKNLEILKRNREKDEKEEKEKQLHSCLTAAKYDKETGEVTIASVGDTRGFILTKNGEIKNQTALHNGAADVVKYAVSGPEVRERYSDSFIKKIEENFEKEELEEIKQYAQNKERIDDYDDKINDILEKKGFRYVNSTMGYRPQNSGFKSRVITVDTQRTKLNEGDTLILMTDGIDSHDALSEREISDRVKDSKVSKALMRELIEEGRVDDDATGIIVRMKKKNPEESDQPSSSEQ